MKKFSTFKPGTVHYATVHSLLGLKAEINERTGKEEFKESKDPSEVRVEQFNVLFLDETSQLADEIFMLLLKHVRKGLKILFIGDPIQIPPVNHLQAIPFKPESVERYKMGVSELTHIERQAGENPILRLATTVRMGYKTVPHFQIETDMISGSPTSYLYQGVQRIQLNDDSSVDRLIMEYFVSEGFKADPDYMKIIAWRNKTVDAFNDKVRNRIYAEDVQNKTLMYIMPGEKLIVDKPVVLAETNKVLLGTNEEIEVMDYDIRSTSIPYNTAEKVDGNLELVEKSIMLQYYMARVAYFDVFNKRVSTQIRILHEHDRKEFDIVLQGIADAAHAVTYGNPMKKHLWRSFFDLKKMFAQVKYNYAITAHKSQGSTYDNTLVLDWDISENKKIEERNRIRYVSFTRARNLLLIQK
jgi:ATP-dependent exoDNAse (exonuclease V) alpha subunit